jgi:acyl-CoA thioesterase-1
MKKYTITVAIMATFLALFFPACENQEELAVDPPIHYLALGDSYTIGQGVGERERWPNQLSVKLRENAYEVADTKIIARTGWTTGELLNALAEEEDTTLEGYNLVSLLIGVNNQYRKQAFEIFRVEFDSLLNLSIAYGGSQERVFVLSIPDYGVTPFGSSNRDQIAQEIDMYNDYIRQRCVELAIPFVDVTGISRQLGDSPGALAPDNLHPSGNQYTQWVEAALPVVLGILAE